MDKCIKVELPTGHVLLEWDAVDAQYRAATGDSNTLVKKYVKSTYGSPDYAFTPHPFNDAWVNLWISGGVLLHFKVIAQYGDEFPV